MISKIDAALLGIKLAERLYEASTPDERGGVLSALSAVMDVAEVRTNGYVVSSHIKRAFDAKLDELEPMSGSYSRVKLLHGGKS